MAATLSARVNLVKGPLLGFASLRWTKRDVRRKQPPEPIKFPRGTETVLLVDDEDFVRDFGERILGRYGYKVLVARNGKEALEIYRKEKDNISLVILDLIMPEMGGKQCMKELLKINPTVKVLVASGYESGGGPLVARQVGAAGFVRKPFNVAQILQNVRQIIDS